MLSGETTGYVVLSEGTPEVVIFTHILVLDLWCYQEKLLDMRFSLRILLKSWCWFAVVLALWCCSKKKYKTAL